MFRYKWRRASPFRFRRRERWMREKKKKSYLSNFDRRPPCRPYHRSRSAFLLLWKWPKKKKNPKMKYRNTFKRKRNVSIRANEKQQIILIIIWNLAHIQQACHLSIIFKNFRCAVEKKELNPSRGRQRQRCNIAKMKNKKRSKMTSRI